MAFVAGNHGSSSDSISGSNESGVLNKSFGQSVEATSGVTEEMISYRGETSNASNNRKIILKIFGPDGMEVHMRAKRNIPMKKIFLKYCEEKHYEYLAMRFFRHGKRVLVRATPDELHLKDGSRIDAMVMVDGGGGGWN